MKKQIAKPTNFDGFNDYDKEVTSYIEELEKQNEKLTNDLAQQTKLANDNFNAYTNLKKETAKKNVVETKEIDLSKIEY